MKFQLYCLNLTLCFPFFLSQIQVVAKAMIRLLRSHTEVQCLVLNSIASMTSSGGAKNSSMFEPHLRNFFIRSGTDPTHIKILKLEIMTNLATSGNIGIVLREFQSYITGIKVWIL